MVIDEYKNAMDSMEVRQFSAEELEHSWRKRRRRRKAFGGGTAAAVLLAILLFQGIFGPANNLVISVYAADGQKQKLSAEVLPVTAYSDIVIDFEGNGIDTITVDTMGLQAAGEEAEFLIAYREKEDHEADTTDSFKAKIEWLDDNRVKISYDDQMAAYNGLIVTVMQLRDNDSNSNLTMPDISLDVMVQYKDGKTESETIKITAPEDNDNDLYIALDKR